jgi:anti-sigma regulatory factor (Ser/Thr protein kinase)
VALELPCRPDSPAAARQEMARLEPELGHAEVARVRVVVTEMVSNCVWNGGGGSVLVEVTARPSTIRGEVEELGPGSDSRSPDPTPFRRGGFGLLLVRRLADRTGALTERRGMWFEIDRPDDA